MPRSPASAGNTMAKPADPPLWPPVLADGTEPETFPIITSTGEVILLVGTPVHPCQPCCEGCKKLDPDEIKKIAKPKAPK